MLASFVIGDSMELGRAIVKIEYWLCPVMESQHFNTVVLFTDSVCVQGWISVKLTRKAKVHTKDTGEMLI